MFNFKLQPMIAGRQNHEHQVEAVDEDRQRPGDVANAPLWSSR